jgi:hypothetical protein
VAILDYSNNENLILLKNAISGGTKINGGLVLTNLIALQDKDGNVTAGINGLDTPQEGVDNDLRFWAGSDLNNSSSAPFRVYENGQVFGKLFYASLQSMTLTSEHITIGTTNEYFIYDNGVYRLNVDNLPDTITLGANLANYSIGLPIKYGQYRNIEIFNPSKIALSFLDSTPNPIDCTLTNFRESKWGAKSDAQYIMPYTSALSMNNDVLGYMSYNFGFKDKGSINYTPTYIRLKNIPRIIVNAYLDTYASIDLAKDKYCIYIPTWITPHISTIGGTPSYMDKNLGDGETNTHKVYYSSKEFKITLDMWIVDAISEDYLK